MIIKGFIKEIYGDKYWDNYLKNGKKFIIDYYYSLIDIILDFDK